MNQSAHSQKTALHQVDTLIRLFNQTFCKPYQTVLVSGEGDPYYRPACERHRFHTIYFAHGFFSSALHEVAHWCIAGRSRRLQLDFGYWYKPDGRSTAEQRLFEQVEVKPQALEWIFSEAAQHRFHFSADNLNGNEGPSSDFKHAVWQQVGEFLSAGLPKRAGMFCLALRQHFQTPALNHQQFRQP